MGALHSISDDRGDESFADDLNMGRGIVSGRVALLLRSTEIRPHRPNDLLPPKRAASPGWDAPRGAPNTWAERNPQRDRPTGRYPGVGARRDSQGARHQIFLSSGESPGVGVTLDLEIFEPGLAARARESPREPGLAARARESPRASGVGKYSRRRLVAVMRSYQGYYTRSHQNSEVKRLWAGIVLGWVTSREVPVLHPF